MAWCVVVELPTSEGGDDALVGFDADEIVIALNPEEEALFAERVATADLRPSVAEAPCARSSSATRPCLPAAMAAPWPCLAC
jgi:hypothetical protein